MQVVVHRAPLHAIIAFAFFFTALTPRLFGQNRPVDAKSHALMMHSIAVVRGTPWTVYAGLNSGLLVSDDGGRSWLDTGIGGPISAVAVSAGNADHAWAACCWSRKTEQTGLWHSDDRGRSWKRVGLQRAGKISDIAIQPDRPDVILVAAEGGGKQADAFRGVYRSRDRGASWQRILYIDEYASPMSISLNRERPRQVLVGVVRHARAESGSPRGGRDGDALEVWASTDDGSTWSTRLRHLAAGNVRLCGSPAGSRLYAAMTDGSAVTLYRSDDLGLGWERIYQAHDLAIEDCKVAVDDASEVWLVGRAAHRSVDGGRTFTAVSSAFHIDRAWMEPSAPGFVLLATMNGLIFSTDRGGTWGRIAHPATDVLVPPSGMAAATDAATSAPPATSRCYPSALRPEGCPDASGERSTGVAAVNREALKRRIDEVVRQIYDREYRRKDLGSESWQPALVLWDSLARLGPLDETEKEGYSHAALAEANSAVLANRFEAARAALDLGYSLDRPDHRVLLRNTENYLRINRGDPVTSQWLARGLHPPTLTPEHLASIERQVAVLRKDLNALHAGEHKWSAYFDARDRSLVITHQWRNDRDTSRVQLFALRRPANLRQESTGAWRVSAECAQELGDCVHSRFSGTPHDHAFSSLSVWRGNRPGAELALEGLDDVLSVAHKESPAHALRRQTMARNSAPEPGERPVYTPPTPKPTVLERLTAGVQAVRDSLVAAQSRTSAETDRVIAAARDQARREREAASQRQQEQQQAQQRDRAEQAARDRERAERERAQANEAARERQRAERARGASPDLLVGSWRSRTNSRGQHGEFHVQGGGGSYSAVFAGRISWGGGPLRAFRATVRNLRVTHAGIWITYEGEVDCAEFYRSSGYEGLKIGKPWDYYRVTYFPASEYQKRDEHLESASWGCHLATEPPEMTRH